MYWWMQKNLRTRDLYEYEWWKCMYYISFHKNIFYFSNYFIWEHLNWIRFEVRIVFNRHFIFKKVDEPPPPKTTPPAPKPTQPPARPVNVFFDSLLKSHLKQPQKSISLKAFKLQSVKNILFR